MANFVRGLYGGISISQNDNVTGHVTFGMLYLRAGQCNNYFYFAEKPQKFYFIKIQGLQLVELSVCGNLTLSKFVYSCFNHSLFAGFHKQRYIVITPI